MQRFHSYGATPYVKQLIYGRINRDTTSLSSH